MPDPETVFTVERQQPVLIVMPQGAALNYQYQQVHLDTNSMFRLLDEPDLKHVVIDLHCVNYVDSVIISSILRMLIKARNGGGKSVFCNGSEDMQAILKCIKLGKLWPHFDSRAEALQTVLA